MRLIIISALFLSFIPAASYAQEKFGTKIGKVDFFSETILEDIEAKNKKATAFIDIKTGAVQFSVLMKAFEFEQSLMQKHFNEDYVESDKFPQAEFKGIISNSNAINWSKPGSYPAKVKGKMTLHGITRDIETAGTIQVGQGFLTATSVFYILLSDYGIKLSSLASTMISNKIKITTSSRLDPM